jgi:hypothetical protein
MVEQQYITKEDFNDFFTKRRAFELYQKAPTFFSN